LAANPMIVKNSATRKRSWRAASFSPHQGVVHRSQNVSRGVALPLPTTAPCFSMKSANCRWKSQASLLRVLGNRTYRRVGKRRNAKCNIRFLFATPTAIWQTRWKRTRFNEAFYHRANNAFSIEIPSLRHRKEDLPLLVRLFPDHPHPTTPPTISLNGQGLHSALQLAGEHQ
jgi:two-component system NtrC family response regulator